jgi:hypothetical protein
VFEALNRRERTWLERCRHATFVASPFLVFLSTVCARVTVCFVRCASLLPPLGESGKLKLAGDIAQLDSVLHAIIPKRKSDGFQVSRPPAPIFTLLLALAPLLLTDLSRAATALGSLPAGAGPIEGPGVRQQR